ncbi:MAG: (2Fe-2S)-binding protein [Candidatus Paceibacterota bacterium]|jgi:bacterioferritin-associated ferredoxin
MNKTICYCKNIPEETVLNAILNGAKTLKDIKEMTGACTGNQCKELNPSGKCCSGDINTLLNNTDTAKGCSCCCG